MQQTAMVMRTAPGEALVRGRRASACGGCAGKSACGTLGSWFERYAEMRVADPLGASPGDEVVIEVGEGEFLRAALRLYGAPMLGFFVAGFGVRALALAAGFADAELFAALGAIVGMFGVFFMLRNGRQHGMRGARIVSISSRGLNIPVQSGPDPA